MVTPIDSNLSIFNVDHVANHTKDPNATHAQGAQMMDVKKDSDEFSRSVQALENSDAEMRITEKERERQERERKKKKQKSEPTDPAEMKAEDKRRSPSTSMGFSLIA